MCFLCDFKAQAPALAPHRWQARRGFLLAGAAAAAGTAWPALAQVNVGKASEVRKLVPAETLEMSAQDQYRQVLAQARSQRALAPDGYPQLERLRTIARRLIPHAQPWNPRAARWQWEINLIGSKQINAWCMPGGKIAFYTGILETLKLSDDEAAMIMGHEMAHALREHARERLAKTQMTNLGVSIATQLFGLGQVGQMVGDLGAQLLVLKYSREDESEADLVGLEIAARGGYAPEASVSLWQKMKQAQDGSNGGGGGRNADFFSTHPNNADRIQQLQDNVPKVQGLYEQARQR